MHVLQKVVFEHYRKALPDFPFVSSVAAGKVIGFGFGHSMFDTLIFWYYVFDILIFGTPEYYIFDS